jgi:hypothetical protein
LRFFFAPLRLCGRNLLVNSECAFDSTLVARGRQCTILNKNKGFLPQSRFSSKVGPPGLVNHRLQKTSQITEKPQLAHWHSGCKRDARREQSHYWSSRQTHMKANTTTNVASVIMLVILSPFLALAILVSIQTAGIKDNEVLLLMLTLLSAVLSGINGFGRRTSKAVPLSTAKTTGDTRLHLSARSSNNA